MWVDRLGVCHQANLPAPIDLVNGDDHSEHLVQPVTKAGDVVLFSEGTVHGARPWVPKHKQRRVALYRFAPSTVAYGRTYAPEWPAAYTAGMSDAQKAVLLPPYHVRCERPVLTADGSGVTVTARAPAKKEFDRRVFGTEFF